jgi:hypothetical protein
MDLGGVSEDDLTLDVEGQPSDEKDADVDALDTDDEAEDQELGIDTEESEGELLVSHCKVYLSSDSSNAYYPVVFSTPH